MINTDVWKGRNYLVSWRQSRAAEIEPRKVLQHVDMQGSNLVWCFYAHLRMMKNEPWFRHLKPEDVKLALSKLYPTIHLNLWKLGETHLNVLNGKHEIHERDVSVSVA